MFPIDSPCCFKYILNSWICTVKASVVSPGGGPIGNSMRQKGSISLGAVGSAINLQRPGPSEFCFKGYNFLVTHRPTDATLPTYVEVRTLGHDWDC